MIIVVADLHLGSQMANKSGFYEFINAFLKPNQNDISRIVLLGDILDLWRNTNSKVLSQNLDVLADLGRLDVDKSYLVGNHDYAILGLVKQNSSSALPKSIGVLDQVSETLEIVSDGLKLKFIHGHQIDYWPALSFYEIFSQAMCFVDTDDQDLSDVWNIVYRFAEALPENTKNMVRNISHETQVALEEKLAGPLNGNVESEKRGLRYEWELLQNVSNFEDNANRYATSLGEINEFAKEWERILDTLDNNPTLPQHLQNEVHHVRRQAAGFTVGLQEDEFLIRGHGHTQYVNQETKVADAGCWLGERGSYIKIIDNQVSVHQWK